jgi:F0F1-type ATP synthase assembly protein I
MSLSISIPKTTEQIPLDSLLVLTRTAFGLGIGMLVADKIKHPVRQATAIALISLGVLAAVPSVVKAAMERINRPESERGSRNRLRSIRGDNVYPSDNDLY